MTDTPAQSLTPNTFDRRAFLRSINFWRPADLSIHVGSVGDDYRGNLATSETVIYGLLLCHSVSPGFDTNTNTWTKGEGKCVSGERDPVTHQPILRHVAYNSRQPVVATLWDRGGGIVPWITDGRQRGRSSEGMSLRESVGEMGAVEAINHRLKMIVDLAAEIDPVILPGMTKRDSDYLNANELSIKVRNEAKMRCQRFNAGDANFKDWHWAKNGEIALYLGGRLGDEKSNQQQHGLINWRSMSDGGPLAVEFVCWTVFEPDDRDPASVETLIGSVVLKQAHVADPPSVECRRTAAIINAPDDPVFPGEGVPVSTLARLFGVSRVTIQKRAQIMMLIPEVRDELDAYARGEDGLSMVQVHDGGFFHAGSGSDDVRIPKTRDEQLALIAKLKGTRGIGALREADLGRTVEAAGGVKERNYSVEGGGSSPRELDSGDSGLARHAADEPRAPVGPDSPTAAGIAPKAAALTPDLARAIADSIDGKIEEMTPDHNGKLADGTEACADDQQVRRQLLAVYQFLRLLAGDVTALTGDDEMPAAVNKFRLTCRDAVEEVLQAHGMAIKPVGMVATGAPVLAAGARQLAELIVTPRAGGEAAVVDGLAGAASGAVQGVMGVAGAVVRKSKHGAAVKKKGLDKKARAAVTAGVEVAKPTAVAKVKAVKEPKPAKPPKEPKLVKEKVVKTAKEAKVKAEKPKVAKEPKAAKAAKVSVTPTEPIAS